MRALWIIAAGLLISMASCDKNDDTAATPGGTPVAGQEDTITVTDLIGSYMIERYLFNGDEIEELNGKVLKLMKEGDAVLAQDTIVSRGFWKYDPATGYISIEMVESYNNYWSNLVSSERWGINFSDGFYLELRTSVEGTDRRMTMRTLESNGNGGSGNNGNSGNGEVGR